MSKSKAEKVKVVVIVPESHTDAVRQALGQAGTGKISHYEFCSFSVKGVGRFRPLKGARPAVGKIGRLEEVVEERVEVVCEKKDLKKVIESIKKSHPYEEPIIDVYPLLSY